MLRIFGLYSYANYYKDTISKMRRIFETKSKFTKLTNFNQNNIFVDYEMANASESKNFYFVNAKEQIACFITGNIYAYKKSRLEILQGKNIAKFIIAKQNKEGFDFIKYLRGEFNIIIIIKNQLFLINDVIGLSPMYIYPIEDGFLFCNYAEPIIWLNKENCVDYSSIAEFLVYGFVPGGKTFIRGLVNQQPGTIVTCHNKKIAVKRYAVFRPLSLEGASTAKIINLTKDIFSESVRIRAGRGHAFSSLSGGWDTRFVLANLLELNKKVIIFTEQFRNEDVKIASKIAEKINLDHIICNPSSLTKNNLEVYNFNFEFRSLFFDNALSGIFNKGLDYLNKIKFFISPRFTGNFGNQLFGYVPHWFIARVNLNIFAFSSEYFTDYFLLKLGSDKSRRSYANFNITDNPSNYIYLFLAQFGRSYINAHYTIGWERPTSFFSYLYLHPFVDSHFVSLLCSLEYNKYMYYKLYTKIFRKYYSDFLDIPWTPYRYRIKSNRKGGLFKKVSQEPEKIKYLRLMTSDKEFRIFLNSNQLVKKTKTIISLRLKELYFIFKWAKSYKSVISNYDYKFFGMH